MEICMCENAFVLSHKKASFANRRQGKINKQNWLAAQVRAYCPAVWSVCARMVIASSTAAFCSSL